MKTEKCDLCGVEVRHVHDGWNRETEKAIKICCACRDNIESPLEHMIKGAIPPTAESGYARIPCMIDEVMDLDDQALVALFLKALDDLEGDLSQETIARVWGTRKACGTELERRGRSDLLISAIESEERQK
jgi:hypothetical protein